MNKDQQLIETIYAAFNARDINSILAVMHPEVKWPRAWEGDHISGHDEVRAYWEKQWKEINPKVTPISFRERENGTMEVRVAQLVRDLEGNVLFDGEVTHVYTIDDGSIRQMDID